MSLISVADLPAMYASVVAQGAQVVAIQAYNENGSVDNPPKDLIINPEDVVGAQGFAWIANHQKSGKAYAKVQVKTLRPPYDLQVSDFIEPSAVAAYVASGKPKGTPAVSKGKGGTANQLTGTSTFNEVTHTTVATFKS